MNFIFYFIVKKLLKTVSTPIDTNLVTNYILVGYTNIGGGGGFFTPTQIIQEIPHFCF